MFSIICKNLLHLSPSARSSLVTFRFYRTKSVVESSKKSKKASFVVSYLVNKCGFSPEKAVSASNYLKFRTTDRPDSVLEFLRNHGFTESQVSNVVRRDPKVLLCDPMNTLLPKIEFFKSIGFEVEDFTYILCAAPTIFLTSLENQLLPTVDFLRKILSSDEKMKVCLKRGPWIFFPNTRALLVEHIQCLREMGVDESRIACFVHHQPRLFAKDKDKFRNIIEEVKGLGFDPSRKTFVSAVSVRGSMSKTTWDKKISVYKKWGLSEDEILETFGKSPWFLSSSEEKIVGVMDFLVNKLGFSSSVVLTYPAIIGYSLEKRIVPRCAVCQVLFAKGLLVKDINAVYSALKVSEKKFLKRFVEPYDQEVPELLKLYRLSCLSEATEDSLLSPQES